MFSIFVPVSLGRFIAIFAGNFPTSIRYFVYAGLLSAIFYFVTLLLRHIILHLDTFLALHARRAGHTPPAWIFFIGQLAYYIPKFALVLIALAMSAELILIVHKIINPSGLGTNSLIVDIAHWIRVVLIRGR